MSGKVRIIGLDWATQPAKIGYAVYEWEGAKARAVVGDNGPLVGTFKRYDMKGILGSVHGWAKESKSLISSTA